MSDKINITRGIFERLISSGATIGNEYPIEFAFAGDWARLSKLETFLEKKGYRRDRSQTDQMLIMVGSFQLKLDSLLSLIEEMTQLANEFGVTYDGWSIAP
ncbi:hypothetical protein A2763_01665 [Candidatus Kaiserbacteria bacterium RIFCSPHIGHO2_01_FULL_54_36]|uniref:Regulator of ribonuclease activity B domain-containing protein n=1 Tax=Candidatus Kaiserbacteria bacterium RIFCSPHIGHO2_01_FULL_54_36 TaxID=1798482 RepID=A0A1F6CNK9_9BACT|nr:MAG: hypothetical protein A2763_01665 [Candidatus Kaiserbacteria bacterium RIFCSPHIGHO2_01_FULL_54_36]OGG75827.1 MAG: hypothetical protein A3A41_02700 [Candidatus Kaiserbacteria bacterium RIFCSPLOWO2_01_FULL_54_22]